MEMSVPQNVQLHPTRKIVVPNDRITKVSFYNSVEKYKRCLNSPRGYYVVEMKKHYKYGEILTPVHVYLKEELIKRDPTIAEPLGQFDLDVANVCISEWEAGNRYVTYSTIYRTLTGKVGESDYNPSKDQLAAIKQSLKKLMNVSFEIDLSPVCARLGYNNSNPCKIKNFIIPARFVDCTVNGQKTSVIELTAASPLLIVARVKNNQIVSYDVELLNVPKQKNTPLNIALKHYALRRVMEIKSHQKQMSPAITFEDVLDKCQIADADNKKKYRVREFLKSFFEHLVNNGVITAFQVNKKAGVFYSISFDFGDTKQTKKSQPLQKQTESKPSEMKPEKPKKIEQGASFQTNWSLEMPLNYQWKYRRNTTMIMPWNTDIAAVLKFIRLHEFLAF